jgi:peptide/nickel transport system substrate-binding protein
MRLTRFSLVLFPFFMVLALMLAGCSSVPAAQANDPAAANATSAGLAPAAFGGGTIARALTSEPPAIDPQAAPHSGLSLLLPYLYDTLVVRDVDNQVLPGLAEKWTTAPDGLAITMTLKSGVTFHSGAPLNADAVKFTFERFKKEGKASPIYGGIMQMSAIEAPGPQTVVFRFKAPAANFFSTISMPYAGIVDPKSADASAGSKVTALDGSGPFKLGEWKAGQFIELVRNDAYGWGPTYPAAKVTNTAAPHVERLLFKVIPDATTQLNALQAGEADVIFVNNPSHKKKLEADPNVEVHEAVLNSLVYLGYNCAKAPFANAAVRQALSYAIDKAQIVQVALGGAGQAADAPLPPSLPGYDAALKQAALGFDAAKAQELLGFAGFTKGGDGMWLWQGKPFKPVLLTSARAPNDTIATLIQAQLKAIGVDSEIQLLDSKAVMDATTKGKFDLLLFRYDWNDPDALNIYLGSDRIGSTNRVAYKNEKVDALLKQGARQLDEAKRVQLYVDAQRLILQDAPWQPLYYPVDVIAVAKRVQGEQVGYMGRLLLNDATVTK